MGKFSDTRRHKSWSGPYAQAQVLGGQSDEEDLPLSRILVFTAPYGEGSEIPRIFANYERKLKFNPGIISDLYENIASVAAQGSHPFPDEDSMEIITSKNWHPGLFPADAGEETVKAEALRCLQEREPGASVKKTLMMRIETERCLVFCVML